LTHGENSPEELERWKADLDGVLGSIGLAASPNNAGRKTLAGSHSNPTSPTLLQGELAPLTINSDRELKSVEYAVLSKAESPLDALFRSVDRKIVSLNSSEYVEEDEEVVGTQDPNGASFIRVVVTDDQDASPVRPKLTSGSSSKRHSIIGDLPALATINETSHSRENSYIDPDSTVQPNESPNMAVTGSPNILLNDHFFSPEPVATPLRSRPSTPDTIAPSLYLQSLKDIPTPSATPVSDTPTMDQAKLLARQCWEEDESFLDRKKIAEWLGSACVLRWLCACSLKRTNT
jgi:hypothetical protein